MENYLEYNTDAMEVPAVGNDLYTNRTALAQADRNQKTEVTIVVQTYNRLEKVKRCIESILAHTKGINYQLLLLDNGSTDQTVEYFKSIPYENKRIVRITKNLMNIYASTTLGLQDFAQYIAHINDDIIVTEHWLDNLLTCIKSDPKIGMVQPVSSNASNLQTVDLNFSSYEEMQKKAAEYNRSDPRKWEDRLRLITIATLCRKELFLCMGWPILDAGFFHDFGDDDVAFAIRRAGYRTVLACDTWICHDHDVYHLEEKDPEEFMRSIDIGRQNFREKYFGLDAWEDANNYWLPYADSLPILQGRKDVRVLGVDTRCGAPILDIKNLLRRVGTFDTELSAFTQDAKYWVDLKTICAGSVICDREEFLADSFARDYFDYVLVDRPLNRYHEPQKLLRDAFGLCKSGGFVFCKLKNTGTVEQYINLLGQHEVYDPEFAYNIPIEALEAAVRRFGTIVKRIEISRDMPPDQQQALAELLPGELAPEQRYELIERMMCHEYILTIQKR